MTEQIKKPTIVILGGTEEDVKKVRVQGSITDGTNSFQINNETTNIIRKVSKDPTLSGEVL